MTMCALATNSKVTKVPVATKVVFVGGIPASNVPGGAAHKGPLKGRLLCAPNALC